LGFGLGVDQTCQFSLLETLQSIVSLFIAFT
jgi:hypothetical protein